MIPTKVVAVMVLLRVAVALPSRNLTNPTVNPGCENCEKTWVVVTVAEGNNSTLHHLWGTQGALSFLVVAGTGGAELKVDWEALQQGLPGSITFEKQPSHVFGLVISNLILYNDARDNGAFKGQNESVRVAISEFSWDAEVLSHSFHQVAIKLTTSRFRNKTLPSNTRIKLQVSAYGEDGRSTVLPHLLYTPDSAQIDLILDHLKLDITEAKEWKRMRWGMDVVVFSSEHSPNSEDTGIKFFTQKSLDDEHTPGVFNLDQITTEEARTDVHKSGGYLQWRPVSYLTSDRDIASATTPNLNTPLQFTNLTSALSASLAYAVLGDNLTSSNAVSSVVSFGQPGDGFYEGTNYTTWTVAMGEGVPPKETFSTTVVVVIIIGVLLPGVMFLSGCVGQGIRWFHRRRRSSENALIIS